MGEAATAVRAVSVSDHQLFVARRMMQGEGRSHRIGAEEHDVARRP
jgi:hypothetical protein